MCVCVCVDSQRAHDECSLYTNDERRKSLHVKRQTNIRYREKIWRNIQAKVRRRAADKFPFLNQPSLALFHHGRVIIIALRLCWFKRVRIVVHPRWIDARRERRVVDKPALVTELGNDEFDVIRRAVRRDVILQRLLELVRRNVVHTHRAVLVLARVIEEWLHQNTLDFAAMFNRVKDVMKPILLVVVEQLFRHLLESAGGAQMGTYRRRENRSASRTGAQVSELLFSS